ncbi:MAG TPA: hypothetical protein PKA16_05575 [Ottowia sp.]|nr:hypothetical protein [Ottowia sp.]
MLANPAVGVDLPLKLLVSEARSGEVSVLFTPAAALIEHHALPSELAANLEPAERLVQYFALSGGARPGSLKQACTRQDGRPRRAST